MNEWEQYKWKGSIEANPTHVVCSMPAAVIVAVASHHMRQQTTVGLAITTHIFTTNYALSQSHNDSTMHYAQQQQHIHNNKVSQIPNKCQNREHQHNRFAQSQLISYAISTITASKANIRHRPKSGVDISHAQAQQWSKIDRHYRSLAFALCTLHQYKHTFNLAPLHLFEHR